MIIMRNKIHRLEVRGFPPQTCRHYYFSALTAAGVQGGQIAKIGGHSNYSTTMKNYVKILLEDKFAAVNKIYDYKDRSKSDAVRKAEGFPEVSLTAALFYFMELMLIYGKIIQKCGLQ